MIKYLTPISSLLLHACSALLVMSSSTFGFFLPDSSECSRPWDNIPRPFISENKGLFGSASKKLWNVGGAGYISVGDSIFETYNVYDAHTDEDLTAVFFADDDTGWVVGTGGFIAASVNGGEKWKKQKSNSTQTLHSINCADTSNCWASGNEGTVLKTSNGGKTWENIQLNIHAKLLAIRFVDRLVGFVIGDKETLFKTVDGGLTWEAKKIPFQKGASNDLYSLKNLGVRDSNVYCASSLEAVACTKNDGKTWRIEYFDDERNRAFVSIVVTPESFYLVGRCGEENDVVMSSRFGIWKPANPVLLLSKRKP